MFSNVKYYLISLRWWWFTSKNTSLQEAASSTPEPLHIVHFRALVTPLPMPRSPGRTLAARPFKSAPIHPLDLISDSCVLFNVISVALPCVMPSSMFCTCDLVNKIAGSLSEKKISSCVIRSVRGTLPFTVLFSFLGSLPGYGFV